MVGAGPLAQAKIQSLRRAAAEVLVVAPQATRVIRKLAEDGKLRWIPRKFRAADVRNSLLVVAATNSPQVNEAVFRACRRARVLCNVVDDPERCDFYYPAVVRRGALQIAISTSGASPALARRLRQQLEQQFGNEYGSWLETVAGERRKVLRSSLGPEQKRALLEQAVSPAAFEQFTRGRSASTKASPLLTVPAGTAVNQKSRRVKKK